MGRSLGVVLLSLAAGAGVMYAASHFRFRLEPVGEAPVAAVRSAAEPPAAVRYGEPERLPERITRGGRADPEVRQVAAQDPTPAVPAGTPTPVTPPAPVAVRPK